MFPIDEFSGTKSAMERHTGSKVESCGIKVDFYDIIKYSSTFVKNNTTYPLACFQNLAKKGHE
jgi:hypothetical protein